jgi:hypothetical protein
MAAVYPAEEESRGSITLVVRAATAEPYDDFHSVAVRELDARLSRVMSLLRPGSELGDGRAFRP